MAFLKNEREMVFYWRKMEWFKMDWERLIVVIDSEQVVLLEKINKTADTGTVDWRDIVTGTEPAHA